MILNGFKYCYLTPIIISLFFICTQLNGLKTSNWLNSSIWPINGSYQALQFPIWVDLGIMAMKGYFTFSKAPRLEPHYDMQFSIKARTLIEGGWGFYPSAEVQSAYSITSADWAVFNWSPLYLLWLFYSLLTLKEFLHEAYLNLPKLTAQGQFLKVSFTGLNSEFSFFLPRLKSSVCFTNNLWENSWIHIWIQVFPHKLAVCEMHYVKCKQSRSGYELGSLCPFPTTVTNTPRAPQFLMKRLTSCIRHHPNSRCFLLPFTCVVTSTTRNCMHRKQE